MMVSKWTWLRELAEQIRNIGEPSINSVMAADDLTDLADRLEAAGRDCPEGMADMTEGPDTPCVACGNGTTLRICEHYTWCPVCGFETTAFWIDRPGCKHVHRGTMTVIKRPEPPYKFEGAYLTNNDKCSICGAHTIQDGW